VRRATPCLEQSRVERGRFEPIKDLLDTAQVKLVARVVIRRESGLPA
jgi:hypothetical protein